MKAICIVCKKKFLADNNKICICSPKCYDIAINDDSIYLGRSLFRKKCICGDKFLARHSSKKHCSEECKIISYYRKERK